MRSSCALLTALLLLAGCNRVQSPQAGAVAAAPAAVAGQSVAIAGEVVGDFVIGDPIHYANLTVFPISSRVPKTDDRFLTLDEGLASGQVEVREVDGTTISDEESSTNEAVTAFPFCGGAQLAERNVVDAQPADDPFGGDAVVEAAPAADDPFGAAQPADGVPFPDIPPGVSQDEADPFAEDVPPADAPPADAPAAEDPFGDVPSDDSLRATSNHAPADIEELTELFSGEVQASELESDGDVNHLVFINSSERPLYLMPGELIIGGKQDRTIARETIVPPGGKPVQVEVFCVEHGRWSSRTEEELRETIVAAAGGDANAGGLAVSVSRDFVADPADNANERAAEQRTVDLKARGKFVASFGSISSVARRTVQEASEQSAVWERVAQENQRAGTSSDSGAFTANYVDPEIVQALAPYMQELGASVADRPQVVGVLVAVGDEIKTVDVFESTPLFQKMWPKLLKSFAFDALAAEEVASEEASEQVAPAKKEPPTIADARRCLEIATLAQVQEIKTEDGLTMTRREADEMVSFSVHDEESYRTYGGMGGGGGFRGAVHGGGFY